MRIYKPIAKTKLAIPLFTSWVKAGFPSPADDYIEAKIDLNKHLIQHPSSTYLVRIEGHSMTGLGIFPGDIAVVDRSLEPHHQDIVLAVIDGEITIKQLHKYRTKAVLMAANPAYPPITVSGSQDLQIWGVVIHTIRTLKR